MSWTNLSYSSNLLPSAEIWGDGQMPSQNKTRNGKQVILPPPCLRICWRCPSTPSPNTGMDSHPPLTLATLPSARTPRHDSRVANRPSKSPARHEGGAARNTVQEDWQHDCDHLRRSSPTTAHRWLSPMGRSTTSTKIDTAGMRRPSGAKMFIVSSLENS